MKVLRVALVGATGLVGETLLTLLAERQFPLEAFYPLASENSEGQTVLIGNKPYFVQDMAEFDFSQVDLALFCVSAELASTYVPKALEAGAWVIDNSSQYRDNPAVPLVVPEVNGELLKGKIPGRLIANPNCSTIQLVVALKPIYDAVGITRINVATYQSVSGAGREGLNELAEQTGALLNGKRSSNKTFPHTIAFNLIPHIDRFEENGYTKEEMKMVKETQKILGDSSIRVNPTAVRVPVFFGHSEAVHIETDQKITVEEAKTCLRQAPGVVLLEEDSAKGYPTPVTHGSAKDAVFVGRIREDISHPTGLNLWIVADNVRKGAALNALQIAEALVLAGQWE